MQQALWEALWETLKALQDALKALQEALWDALRDFQKLCQRYHVNHCNNYHAVRCVRRNLGHCNVHSKDHAHHNSNHIDGSHMGYDGNNAHCQNKPCMADNARNSPHAHIKRMRRIPKTLPFPHNTPYQHHRDSYQVHVNKG